MARTLANIQKRHYRVMHRAPAAFDSPVDPTTSAANFATWLASFTELGYCRDKTIKMTIESSEPEVLDTGKEKQMGYNGHLEGILLQSETGDYTAYETIENVEQDILLYSEVTGMCNWLGAAILIFKESLSSGEVEVVPFEYNANDLATKEAFRTKFEEPTT
jgi:hypothetical protein